MTDAEFDVLLEAAYQEAKNDPEVDDVIDMTGIALQVHSDLLQTYHSELHVRGNVTEIEIKRIEAVRQALCCYYLLFARKALEQGLALLTKTKTSELSKEELVYLTRILVETHKDLEPLDEIEPLARKTLVGIGLPATIEEFEEFNGNRYRIKLNMDACTLASDNAVDKLQAVLDAAAEQP
jgi:hypothetical protein